MQFGEIEDFRKIQRHGSRRINTARFSLQVGGTKTKNAGGAWGRWTKVADVFRLNISRYSEEIRGRPIMITVKMEFCS